MTAAHTRAALAGAEVSILGRLAGASNATLRGDADGVPCVYKPMRGERPLWDFPEWTLGRREVAAYELSEALGWGLVPPTAWRTDGPSGPGMCQLWIEEAAEGRRPVTVVPEGEIPPGYLHVLDAQDHTGRDVSLVHESADDLARIAVFDILANNADRKGGHILVDADDRLWAIDHGVTFAADPKLRTVLWGWSGDALPESLLSDLEELARALRAGLDDVDRWLDDDEREALRYRCGDLLRERSFPVPTGHWPAIPWPVF